jgi:hypothetical protein
MQLSYEIELLHMQYAWIYSTVNIYGEVLPFASYGHFLIIDFYGKFSLQEFSGIPKIPGLAHIYNYSTFVSAVRQFLIFIYFCLLLYFLRLQPKFWIRDLGVRESGLYQYSYQKKNIPLVQIGCWLAIQSNSPL